jgi:hypothetical protein
VTGLESSLLLVADEFEQCLGELAVEHVERQRREVAEFEAFDAPEVWEVVKRITHDSRRLQAVHVRAGMTLPQTCPGPDVEAAHLSAHGGLTLTSVIQSYGIGHALATDAWLDSVDRVELDAEHRRDCVRALTRFCNAYDDRVMTLVTDEYQRESEKSVRSPDQIRLRRLRDLIEGVADRADELDYDLDASHVGVIAWGPGAQTAVRELAAALDRRLLWAPASDQLVWAWLGGSAPVEQEAWAALRDLSPPSGSRLALGNPGSRLAGFRLSHRQAGEAHVVAARTHDLVTLYADVTLEAFALRDEAAAREFTQAVLGEFSDDREPSVQARATLRAYFAASQNGASAAAGLGVHEQTVARRLRAIEQEIGFPVNERRAELELALRLNELLWP